MNAKEEASALLSRVGFAALLGESTREDWVNLRSGFAEVLAYYEDDAIDAIRERDAARGEVDKLRAELEKTHTMKAILSAVRAALGIGEHADLAKEAKHLSYSFEYWRKRFRSVEAEVADLREALQKRTTELQIAVEERAAARSASSARHDRLLAIANELGISYEAILDNLIEIRDWARPNPGESVLEALRRQLVPARAEIGDKQ